MKTIIEHGRTENNIQRFCCKTCSCVFDATRDDYDIVFFGTETYYESVCPDCGAIARIYEFRKKGRKT